MYLKEHQQEYVLRRPYRREFISLTMTMYTHIPTRPWIFAQLIMLVLHLMYLVHSILIDKKLMHSAGNLKNHLALM